MDLRHLQVVLSVVQEHEPLIPALLNGSSGHPHGRVSSCVHQHLHGPRCSKHFVALIHAMGHLAQVFDQPEQKVPSLGCFEVHLGRSCSPDYLGIEPEAAHLDAGILSLEVGLSQFPMLGQDDHTVAQRFFHGGHPAHDVVGDDLHDGELAEGRHHTQMQGVHQVDRHTAPDRDAQSGVEQGVASPSECLPRSPPECHMHWKL